MNESQRLAMEVRERNTAKEPTDHTRDRLFDEILITLLGLQSAVARHERKFAQTSARIDEVEQRVDEILHDPELPAYVGEALRPLLGKLHVLGTPTTPKK